MFMRPLSSATSLGVFCRMETKQHSVNTADVKRFILTDFWDSVLLPGLFCLQSFSIQIREREGLAFLTMWSSNNLQSSLSPAYHVTKVQGQQQWQTTAGTAMAIPVFEGKNGVTWIPTYTSIIEQLLPVVCHSLGCLNYGEAFLGLFRVFKHPKQR